MASYHSLRKCQIAIAFFNILIYFGLTISGIALATDPFFFAIQLSYTLIILGAISLLAFTAGVFFGISGPIKEDYC